ncbi:DNA-processing protein DprA [Pseudomonas alloputida]|uniref:DNA-processing protein DprA n=1 Tax=Pseudomonas alloputida TaxID=1940621 RepID=UPI001E585208|nr:DNA-processing protein DprA [Pseudomonas alloputida]MCE1054962.1 DNA-protecting protein DprA [Pseudomonas alloputida]
MDDKDYWRSERVAFLALSQLKGIGYWTMHKWSLANISFKDVLREPEKFGIEKSVPSVSEDIDDPIEFVWRQGLSAARQLAALNVALIFKEEPDFPQRLRDIADGPAWIFVQGVIANLYGPTVGVVGTREPSEDGIFLTRMVVAALHGIKLATVSGLAMGIDQVAHIESLNCHIPTIAVLGTGILENYPKNSDRLRKKILSMGGTIVTEYLPFQSYSAENFVRRNRIQAALSDVLIPVEWKVKSGTAHTVRYAKSYGKRVIAVALPYYSKDAPETVFIRDECDGMAFELPRQSDTLCNIIATFSENELLLDEDILEQSGVMLESVESVESVVSERPKESVNEVQSAPSGQLPLI